MIKKVDKNKYNYLGFVVGGNANAFVGLEGLTGILIPNLTGILIPNRLYISSGINIGLEAGGSAFFGFILYSSRKELEDYEKYWEFCREIEIGDVIGVGMENFASLKGTGIIIYGGVGLEINFSVGVNYVQIIKLPHH